MAELCPLALLAGSVLEQSWQVVAANEGGWSFQLQIEILLALLLDAPT